MNNFLLRLKSLPASWYDKAQSARLLLLRKLHLRDKSLSLEEDFPYSSPNVWKRVVDFYLARPEPLVFEYGGGVSSLHHIGNLLRMGGRYIGVEHSRKWYIIVVNALLRYCVKEGLSVKAEITPAQMPPEFPVAAYDVDFNISGANLAGCRASIKLRPAYNRVDPGEGTFAEFKEYVCALKEPCDVVVVDGRARKACVNYALDSGLIKTGGLLVLMEAGRGKKGWLGSHALQGTNDYQPEVKRMLALGGELADGNGIDSWSGLRGRRTIGRHAYNYPIEACFLVKK